jgi:hypothetical protein
MVEPNEYVRVRKTLCLARILCASRTKSPLTGCGKTQNQAIAGALYESPFLLESTK